MDEEEFSVCMELIVGFWIVGVVLLIQYVRIT